MKAITTVETLATSLAPPLESNNPCIFHLLLPRKLGIIDYANLRACSFAFTTGVPSTGIKMNQRRTTLLFCFTLVLSEELKLIRIR